MAFEFTKNLRKYFKAFDERLVFVSVPASLWEIGKIAIEGRSSIESFILGLNWVMGWITIVTISLPLGSAALPMLIPCVIMIALLNNPHDMTSFKFYFVSVTWLATNIIVMNLKLTQRFWDSTLEIFARIPLFYLMATSAIIGIFLSATINVPPFDMTVVTTQHLSSHNGSFLQSLMSDYKPGFIIRSAGWFTMLWVLAVIFRWEKVDWKSFLPPRRD